MPGAEIGNRLYVGKKCHYVQGPQEGAGGGGEGFEAEDAHA